MFQLEALGNSVYIKNFHNIFKGVTFTPKQICEWSTLFEWHDAVKINWYESLFSVFVYLFFICLDIIWISNSLHENVYENEAIIYISFGKRQMENLYGNR